MSAAGRAACRGALMRTMLGYWLLGGGSALAVGRRVV